MPPEMFSNAMVAANVGTSCPRCAIATNMRFESICTTPQTKSDLSSPRRWTTSPPTNTPSRVATVPNTFDTDAISEFENPMSLNQR